MREKRNALSPFFRGEAARAAWGNFRTRDLAIPSKASVGLYSPIDGEISPSPFFEAWTAAGYRLLVPSVFGDALVFKEIRSLDELRTGAFGVGEAPQDAPVVDKADLSILLVPGIAFDPLGHRLGFGKGFYDRFLEGFSGIAIGLAYDFQFLPRVPKTSHDRAVDWVMTDQRAYRVTK